MVFFSNYISFSFTPYIYLCLDISRHHFANKGLYSQSYSFSSSHVKMWELDHKEGWTPKNWCFQLWCWRFLRVPWTAKRSNQSVLKEINPEYSLEGWMQEAEASILWPPDVKSWLIGKDPDAGKDWKRAEGKGTGRDWDGWTASPVDMSLSKLWEIVKDREPWCAAIHGFTKSWTQLSDWTTKMNLQ